MDKIEIYLGLQNWLSLREISSNEPVNLESVQRVPKSMAWDCLGWPFVATTFTRREVRVELLVRTRMTNYDLHLPGIEMSGRSVVAKE